MPFLPWQLSPPSQALPVLLRRIRGSLVYQCAGDISQGTLHTVHTGMQILALPRIGHYPTLQHIGTLPRLHCRTYTDCCTIRNRVEYSPLPDMAYSICNLYSLLSSVHGTSPLPFLPAVVHQQSENSGKLCRPQ